MKDILKPVGALTLICLIVAALVAAANYVTAPIIAQNEGGKSDEARRLVLPDADRFVRAIDDTELPEGVLAVYRAENGAGFAITTVTTGYHGEITAMFGVDTEGRVAGVEVLSHGETQGLGERITTEGFRAQFRGQAGPFELAKGGAADGGRVEALSGATISSGAMVRAANLALEAYQQAKGAA